MNQRTLVLIGLAIVGIAFASWALRYDCGVCVLGTRLSITATGLRAPSFCRRLAAQDNVVSCSEEPKSAPMLCVGSEWFLEVTVRDEGMLGPGILGTALCSELDGKSLRDAFSE